MTLALPMLANTLPLHTGPRPENQEIAPEELMRIRRMQNKSFQRNLLERPLSAADVALNLDALVRLAATRFKPHLAIAQDVGLHVHEVLSKSETFTKKQILGDPEEQKDFEDTVRDLETQLFLPFMGYLRVYRSLIEQRTGTSTYADMEGAVQECLEAFLKKDDIKFCFQTFLRNMKKLEVAGKLIKKLCEINGDMAVPDVLGLLRHDETDRNKDIAHKTEIFLKYFGPIAPRIAEMIPDEVRRNGKTEKFTSAQRLQRIEDAVQRVRRAFRSFPELTYAKQMAISHLEEELGRVFMDLPSVSDSRETTREERVLIFLGDGLTEGLWRYRDAANKEPARRQWCEDFTQILMTLGEAKEGINNICEKKTDANRVTLKKITSYAGIVGLFDRLRAKDFFPPHVIGKLEASVVMAKEAVEIYLFGGSLEKLQAALRNLGGEITHFELAFSELVQIGYLPQPPVKKRQIELADEAGGTQHSPVSFENPL